MFSGSQQYKSRPVAEVRLINAIGEGAEAPPPFASVEAAIEAGVPLQRTESLPEPEEIQPVQDVWQQLAVCESGMSGQPRWDYNGSSGFDGGIQFHPGTWTAFKPSGYPNYAWQATPYQQIQVGKLVAAQQGAGAWPSCTAKLGISTEDLLQ